MNVDTVALFLALLAVACQLFAVGALVLALGPARWRRAVFPAIAPHAITLAWLIALVAMIGSLYFSEVANFPPCKLCWYQRIAMYPQAVVLGIAVWRRDRGVWPYALTLSAIGALIAAYHVLLERNPQLAGSGTCDVAVPCTTIWVEPLGYNTIPTMALSGFAAIIALVSIARWQSRAEEDNE